MSGQSRDIDLPDGQVGWTRSLPEEGAHTNYEQPDRAESLVRNQIFTIQKVNRITGGGPTRRITPSRAVKDTTPRPDPTFPPLLNVLHLDILQLGNQKMVVADSNIPGAGKGLFTAKAVPAGTRLCTYEGDRLSKEDLPIPDIFPRFDYVWSNTTLTLIIDAFNKTSFGPFMNDPVDEALCNAVIIQHNRSVFVDSTRELFQREEVLTSYGGGFWADRFHLFADPEGRHHSVFQLKLIRNYKLRPLPSGRAVTNQEVLSTTLPEDYMTPDLPIATNLSPYLMDILRDMYGSVKTLSIQLGFSRA